nr:diguanylate cyclase [uncultured Desulfobacter sp.]
MCEFISINIIDKLKSLNDNLGHDAGDIVLQSFAETTPKFMRNDDLFGQFGGEAVLSLLPDFVFTTVPKISRMFCLVICFYFFNNPGDIGD